MWMKYMVKIPLKAGDNEITIEGSWYWMSFDYIALSGPDLVPLTNIHKINDSGFGMEQNIPNPFSIKTNIVYNLPNPGHVLLAVYDITGKQVAELVNKNMKAGTYNTQFNSGHLPGGIYFARLTYNSTSLTRKMVLIK